jgi:hypothetical protein
MALMLLIAVIVPPIGLWALLLVPSGLLEGRLSWRDKRPGAPHGRRPSPIN